MLSPSPPNKNFPSNFVYVPEYSAPSSKMKSNSASYEQHPGESFKRMREVEGQVDSFVLSQSMRHSSNDALIMDVHD